MSTKSSTILIVTPTMNIISIGMTWKKYHANLTVTCTNMFNSHTVTYTFLIFTIGTSTSGNLRQIQSHPDTSNTE